jgi:hypothetical protein
MLVKVLLLRNFDKVYKIDTSRVITTYIDKTKKKLL